jgi:serine/threonine protein kinase
MALNPGTKLGPYEILSPLGAGGMGEVYRARDTRLDRDVAIKVLLTNLASDPSLRQRLEREVIDLGSDLEYDAKVVGSAEFSRAVKVARLVAD